MPSYRSQSIRMSFPFSVKLSLIALFLALDYTAIVERIISLGTSPELVAYLLLYASLGLALTAAGFIGSTVGRVAFAAILATASVALHSYEWATGSPLLYDAFETMVSSRGDAGEAASQHLRVMLLALGAGLILFIGLALPPRRVKLPRGLGWIMPTGAVFALACLLYVRGGEGARALPAPFSPLAQGAIMTSLSLVKDKPVRHKVMMVAGAPLASGDIVLVIDESIAANYLDINHTDGVRSGLAKPRPGVEIANFGIAASTTNCSAGSNLTLRFGGTRRTYREAYESMPSIWAYAHRAGLQTVYLDGQRRGGELQNRMTPVERAEIDDFVQLNDTPVDQRDLKLAELLKERLGNRERELILVNKVGAHFPVADKFPDTAAVFRPLPKRGLSVDIADIAALPGKVPGTADDWRLYRNAYRNTLMWSTGGFFDRLLPQVPGSGAVILYTSDHGQDLHEQGSAGDSTHCVPEPRPEEGAVPLVVIADSGGKVDWSFQAARNFNGMSHFRMFPTLLQLMGYEPQREAAPYGPTLMTPKHEPLSFTSNYSASLGRKPSWLEIHPRELAAPPRTDFEQMSPIHY